MDDTSVNLEIILEQAPKWTFAGDVLLLEWMKQISQDLENRAKKTVNSLNKLQNNVRSTGIALDNVANSLTTLQFGNQFVECRVQDDDEASYTNANIASSDNQKQSEENITSKEMLNTLLNNNLKALRTFYEKYSVDLEDSDEEENFKEKTCIYQPINPYNDRPLPFICGSKDWHSTWHVGLYENQQESSYSGDEISETFSETPSSSLLGDNESFESNTEWASSNSVDNDHINPNIEIKNASSLQGSQPLFPETTAPITVAKNNDMIKELSSTSTTSSLAKNPLQNKKQNDSSPQRPESANSITSKNSPKTTTKGASYIKENTMLQRQSEKILDIFSEPTEDQQSTRSSSISSVPNIIGIPYDNSAVIKQTLSSSKIQPPPSVDLFAKPSENDTSYAPSSMSSKYMLKRKTVNLFEEDEDKDDLLSFLSQEPELDRDISKYSNTLLISANSIIKNDLKNIPKTSNFLFDDSDEDDDFLKAFVRKSSNSKDYERNLYLSRTLKDETKAQIEVENSIDTFSQSKYSIPDETLLEKHVPKENLKKSINLFSGSDLIPDDDLISNQIKKKINLFDDLDNDDESELFFNKSKEKPMSYKQVNDNKTKRKVDWNDTEDSSLDIAQKSNFPEDIDFDKNREESDSGIKNNNSLTKEKNKMLKEVLSNQVIRKNKGQCELPVESEFLTSSNSEINIQNKNNTTGVTEQKTVILSNNVEKPVPPNKYEFNSILFLDEPPEDDKDFFEKFPKTPNTFNVIDLENYMYEPELPKVPVSASSNKQSDTTDNFYTDLPLFRDIPPDDDDVNSNATGLSSDVNQTKRVHSVFYDDFNETLMALEQKPTAKATQNHSIFSDEPPPINVALNSPSIDEMDNNEPHIKEVLYKANDANISENSKHRLASKLQMSNININVEALLPGACSSLNKFKTENINDVNTLKKIIVSDSIIHNSPEISRTLNTEHILPNLTKNRVKALATRRPPTRRARQENIRKSLIEQQKSLETENEISEMENKSNIIDAINTEIQTSNPQTVPIGFQSIEVKNKDMKESLGGIYTIKNVANKTTVASPTSYEDKYQYNHDRGLESSSSVQKIENAIICPSSTKRINVSHKGNDIKIKSTENKIQSLFDDDEEDDDFFNHIQTSKFLNTYTDMKIKGNKHYKSTNASLESITKINTEDAKEHPVPIPKKSSSSVSEEKECEQELESNTDEKLFNESSNNIMIASKMKNQMKTSKLSVKNDLFQTNVEQPSSSTVVEKIYKKSRPQFKSFIDESESESNEEPNMAGLQKITSSVHSTTVPPKKLPKNSSVGLKKNLGLFMSSESDSDDLFGKLPSTKYSNDNKNKVSSDSVSRNKSKDKPHSSLFGYDSDSDDFLASASNVVKNITSTNILKNEPTKTTIQTNVSIFSDLDSDEEDLFSGTVGRVKATSANIPTVRTTKASVTELPKLKIIDDNPLADLL